MDRRTEIDRQIDRLTDRWIDTVINTFYLNAVRVGSIRNCLVCEYVAVVFAPLLRFCEISISRQLSDLDILHLLAQRDQIHETA